MSQFTQPRKLNSFATLHKPRLPYLSSSPSVSLVLPLGLPLVDEGVHALLAVMQREGPVEDPLLRVQTLFQRGLVPEQRMILDIF